MEVAVLEVAVLEVAVLDVAVLDVAVLDVAVLDDVWNDGEFKRKLSPVLSVRHSIHRDLK